MFQEITAVGYQLNSTTWIRPSTTRAVCFVSGDCWLLTEQGQVLPELCVLFQEIVGYRLNKAKYYLSWVLYFLTVGLLRLLFYWLPHRMVQFTFSRCSLDHAEKVIMKVSFSSFFFSPCVRRMCHCYMVHMCVCESMCLLEWERVLYLVCTLNEHVRVCVVPFLLCELYALKSCIYMYIYQYM